MIVAAHQPQYLPWLGYFHKMANCDAFVILDNVQYKKREFQNRNKIRTSKGTEWLTVPVVSKGLVDQVTGKVQIESGRSWAQDHWKSMCQHYVRARYFSDHQGFFNQCYQSPWTELMPLSMEIIRYLRECFGIQSMIYFESALKIHGQKTDRLVEICRALGADTYLSGLGAKEYLVEDRFTENRITLRYQNYIHPVYLQVYPGFEPHCAAVDFLWNHGSERGRLMFKGGST